MFASNKTTTTDEGKFTVRVDIFYYFPLQCDDIFALWKKIKCSGFKGVFDLFFFIAN